MKKQTNTEIWFESLTIYGWAILVVIVAIAALVYFFDFEEFGNDLNQKEQEDLKKLS